MKYIIFDFDGTIADTLKAVKKILINEFKASHKDFKLLRDEGLKSALRSFKIPLWKLAKIKSRLNESNNVKIFPGMIKLINELKSKCKLGIVSSNSEKVIINALIKHGINDYFEFIYSGSSFFGKHLVLKRLCKKHNIKPVDAIYVGDEDRDVIAARKVNIKCIAVTWGFNSARKLSEVMPDYLVNSPNQILKIINDY